MWLVLGTLVSFSVLSWGLFFAKWIYLRGLYKKDKAFIREFWSSKSLESLHKNLAAYPDSPTKTMFNNGYEEFIRMGASPKNERISEDIVFNATMDHLFRSLNKTKFLYKQMMERWIWMLAVCASTAPFIGLFGTVWGIMEAFDAIAKSGVSSLSSVAPGISEALVATAFGLAAAIPAVVGYNYCRCNEIIFNAETYMSDFVSC